MTAGEVSPEDVELLQEYRKSFQRPIAEVFSFVTRAARRLDRGCIVTYRIKRLDTIIEKLRRFAGNSNGGMKLSRMWDVAGCRCIFSIPDESKLYALVDAIKAEYGDDCKINDYVREGAKASGYRSIHVYVKDKTTKKPVEIQVRNYVQHNWATLVEILDVLYGKSIKEGKENGDLQRFLVLYSKAAELTNEEFMELIRIEDRFRIFENMSSTLAGNYLNIKKQWLQQPANGSYFVIEASKKGSTIQSFRSFPEAEDDYYRKYVSNRDANIVLTHIPSATFEQLSMAYSNYVLAMHAFFDDYRVLAENKIVDAIQSNTFFRIFRLFHIYNRNLECHVKNLKMELKNLSDSDREKLIKQSQLNKWRKDIKSRIHSWEEETSSFLMKLRAATSSKSIFRFLVRWQLVRRMSKTVK